MRIYASLPVNLPALATDLASVLHKDECKAHDTMKNFETNIPTEQQVPPRFTTSDFSF
jgi:hypothetical protein